MKKQHVFEYRLFSSIFDTQKHSKDDVISVIVTSFWIFVLLPLRDFVPQYYHAKFGGSWTTSKGETEEGGGGGGGGVHNVVPKYPILNRVNLR